MIMLSIFFSLSVNILLHNMKRNKPWKGGRAGFQRLLPHLALQTSYEISKQPKILKVLINKLKCR